MNALLEDIVSVVKHKVQIEYLHDREDDVGLVLDGFKGHRGNHDNEEVEDPVAGSGQGIGRGTDAEGNLDC